MIFKKINPSDYGDLLFNMDVSAFNRSFDYPSSSIAMTLDYLKNCHVYLAFVDNAPVGVLAYEKKGDGIEVKQIIVLPEYQGKGHGRLIVKKLIDLTKGHHVWLVTHPKNTAAIVLYLKHGFEITEWKANYYGDGEPRLLLKKVG